MPENVIGTDGRYPIVDEEPLWRIWSINQIWNGGAGENRYVPKVKDWVSDPETGDIWIVDHIDPVTLIPTLRSISFGNIGVLSDNDRLLGMGPGAPSDTYRVYLNTDVYPYTLSVDTGCGIKGTMSSYAKIFLGTDTTPETGRVISKVFDNSGNLVSTSTPLDLVLIDSHTNYSLKAVRRCNCTDKLKNGELVTVVIYADDGHVVYKRQMLVENTDTIADVNVGLKYITEISLDTIWMANGSTDTIEYPLNLPMDSLNMFGVVHYSDGSRLRLPVDGSKFTMRGLTSHVSTIPGQKVPLALIYQLGDKEHAYASTGVNGDKITKAFTLVTVNPNNSIQVKLFGYPEWQDNAIGYTMKWFLTNMERNISFDVTPHVRFAENTGPFNPKLYGYLQRKAVSINLRDVSGAFIPFIHTQLVDITLKQPPSADSLPSWTVRTEASDTVPEFGLDTYGFVHDDSTVSFKAGFNSMNDWLQAMYYKTLPLINRLNENTPPAPTHFIVSYNGIDTEYSVLMWDQYLNLGTAGVSGKFASIRFIKRTPTTDLQLSFAAVILKRY